MKKILLVLLALLPLAMMAEQRTASEAQNVANSYLRNKAVHHLMGVSVVQEDVVQMLDLSKPYTPIPDQVIDFAGYFFTENGKPIIYAYDGSDGDKGQAVPISFEWLDGSFPLTEGECYNLHGVVMLTPAASGSPALMADGTVPTNYIVYLTKVPTEITAISSVTNDGVKVNVTDGTINVAGASSVAIYNTAGALVSRNAITQLPAGVYLVVADGKCFKVIVR